jgi:predicted nucleic acid-binding protein
VAFVVDASCLVKLFLDNAGHEAFRAWFHDALAQGKPLHAPHLLVYETGRVIERELDDLPPSEQEELLRRATGAFRYGWGRAGTAFEACREHDLTYYDAAYLQVAIEETADLVTSDKALAKAAGSLGIRVHTF